MQNLKRLNFLRIAICLGLLLGIFFSHELWFPVYRSFPRSPIFVAIPETLVLPFEWLSSSILVGSLILIAFIHQPKILLLLTIFSVILLSFFDQLHMQPWTYQYLLIFIVFFFHYRNDENKDSNQTLVLIQLVIAGLYFWSGMQKMNFTFSSEILPALLEPLQSLIPTVHLPLGYMGIGMAIAESFIGIGLLFRKTRNLAVCMAVFMHAFVLCLLIAKNYNSIVWVWNLTMIFAVVIAFWRNSTSIKESLEIKKLKPIKLIIFASLILPVLSFFGLWDYFLSGTLYSGNLELPVIRINEKLYEKLSPSAKSVVFRTKSSGQQMLPLFEWSIADTNAPIYPQQRVFNQVAKEVCKLADEKNQVELIVRERPALFSGEYKVRRSTCAELEKP